MYGTMHGAKDVKFNIYYFCTATMVTRTRLAVTLHIRCLSCF